MTTSNIHIAVDCMGGDIGPAVTIPACARVLESHSVSQDIHFHLFGDEAKIKPHLEAHPDLAQNCTITHTEDVISGDEKPSAALRRGKNSSMRLAINAVRDGQAQAVVSAGNTGALMAMSKLVLKCLPAIHRPAIASFFPTMHGDTLMLDLGANLECDAENLVQFALLGAVCQKTLRHNQNPTIGLLNIGTEEMKGHEEIREASSILNAVSFPGIYKGFIEGNDIPGGAVDVVVTDGFTGNIALKVAEGTGRLSRHYMRDAMTANFWAWLGSIFARKSLQKLKDKLNPQHYNGGMFLGLEGICIKSHGNSDVYGFSRALQLAADLIHEDFNQRVSTELENLMSQESFFKPEKDLAI